MGKNGPGVDIADDEDEHSPAPEEEAGHESPPPPEDAETKVTIITIITRKQTERNTQRWGTPWVTEAIIIMTRLSPPGSGCSS